MQEQRTNTVQTRSNHAISDHLLMRFLLPLGLVLAVMAILFTGQMYTHQADMATARLHRTEQGIRDLYRDGIEYQAKMLGAVMETISKNQALRDALGAQDQQRLLAASLPLFTKLRDKFGITHFYFSNPQRINILRVHQPQRYGDRIDRYTTLRAEQHEQTAYGVELGPLGTFTLRLVQPWYQQQGGERRLLGFVELGVEIDHILRTMQATLGMDMYLTVSKRYLQRGPWEIGMRMLGRQADWDLMEDMVLNNQASSSLPGELGRNIQQASNNQRHGGLSVIEGEKSYQALFVPLIDAGERQVGYIIAKVDVSKETHALHRAILIGSGFSLLAGGTLMILFFIWTRRIEAELAHSRAQLEILASHDGLTGLQNHRTFHHNLQEELQRAGRYQHDLVMLMLDIDHFKRVNDTYGHLAGDAVLKALAHRVLAETRNVDSVYRYGGEEIAILMPETHTAEAADIAQRIRRTIENHNFVLNEQQTINLTVSIGVASFPQQASSGDELVNAADQALYSAKQAGRNQVRVWTAG